MNNEETDKNSIHKYKQFIKIGNSYLIHFGPGTLLFLILSIIYLIYGLCIVIIFWTDYLLPIRIILVITLLFKEILSVYMICSNPGILTRKNPHTKLSQGKKLDLNHQNESENTLNPLNSKDSLNQNGIV